MLCNFTFPAVINYNDVPGEAAIIFPGLGCCSGQCSINNHDIYEYAQETLKFHIAGMLEDGDKIPDPISIYELEKIYPACSVIPVKITLEMKNFAA